MNSKLLTSLLLPLLLLLVTTDLRAGHGDRQEYEKTYTETFDVDGSGEVRLTNRYGSIRVETWDRDEVRVDVRVTVAAESQEKADRTFDRITISFSGGGNTATATTSIGSSPRRKSKGIISSLLDGEWPDLGYGSSSSGSHDFKVRYVVKMPASASLETDAKYCDVDLPDLSGNANLKVGYGNLVAGDLTGSCDVSVSYGSARIDQLGDNSTFRVRYCDGNEVRQAANLRYDGRYSETEIGTVDRLTVSAGYEEVEVDRAREIRFEGNYNELDVQQVERLYYDGNYNNLNVGLLTREVEIDASYGDIEIEQVSVGFERIYVRANYIDVEVDIDDAAGFSMDLRSRYGSISYDTGRADVNVDKSGSSKSVSGRMRGKGDGRIDISTSYGDIEID